MKVLIDSCGLQARCHAQDGIRLASFLEQLERIPACRSAFSPVGELSARLLSEQDVLVISTRKEFPYSSDEMAAIADFIRQGGGLLLMTNHGDIPNRYPIDLTRHDAVLARAFGVSIETTFFAHPDSHTRVELGGSALLADHPVIVGAVGDAPVRSIAISNCCSLSSRHGDPLIRLSGGIIDHRNGYPAQGRCFAVALDAFSPANSLARGRVVVCADSGFIGTPGTTFPGPGLIGHCDNGRFVMNAVRWLGRKL